MGAMDDIDILSFWGKARPSDDTGGTCGARSPRNRKNTIRTSAAPRHAISTS